MSGVYMSERTDPVLFEVDSNDKVDSPHKRIAVARSDAKQAIAPAIDPVTTAAILLESRAIRMKYVRNDHAGIDDISWHILLDLMVALDAGRPVIEHHLAITHNLAASTISRYVAYLIGIGMIEKNIVAAEGGQSQLRMTASGVELASGVLGEIGRQIADVPEWRFADA